MEPDPSPGRAEACEQAQTMDVERTWSEADLRIHEAELRAAARYICAGDGEQDDLIQDAFERALRFLAKGNARPVHIRPWLVSILRHAFIDRKRRTAVAFVSIVEEPSAIEQDPQPPWSEVALADVRRAVATLEPDLRVPFEMHYFAQVRYREIAAQLRIPANTVATRLLRARKNLREILMRDRVRPRSVQ
jgi:RNA polymerase sigma-70 factor, ECF subfamily